MVRQGAIVVLLVSAMLPSVSPAQSSKVLDRRPFEVIVNVVSRGKEIEIRKLFSCELRNRLHPGPVISLDNGLRRRDVWDQSTHRMYHVLPSNEVLIFELPGVCNPFDERLIQLPANYLPITYWVNDASAPTRAQQIVYHSYFTANPDRQFEVRSFRVEAAPHLRNRPDDDGRLVWLFDSATHQKDAYFVSVYAVAIPRTIWSRYPELAAELSKLGKSQVVDGELVRRTAVRLLGLCEAERIGIGPSNECPFDTRPLTISASRVSEGAWQLRYRDIGVRRYTRLIGADELDKTGCNPVSPTCHLWEGSMRVELNGTTYEVPKGGEIDPVFLFDAERDVLLRLRFRVMSSTGDHK